MQPKFLTAALALVLGMSLTACGTKDAAGMPDTTQNSTYESKYSQNRVEPGAAYNNSTPNNKNNTNNNNTLGEDLKEAGEKAKNGIKDTTKDAAEGVQNTTRDAANGVKDLTQDAKNALDQKT